MADLKSQESGRLLPSILEHRAASEPDRVWAKFPVSSTSYDQGFRAATYSQINSAVNQVAWILQDDIGISTQSDTLAYLGPSDLRYHIVLLAAMKIGYKRRGSGRPLSRLECRVLVTTDVEPPFVSSILSDFSIQVIRIPSLDLLLQVKDVPVYPYDKTFDEVRNDPAFVLHTSGSTGIPKPMIYTHEFVWRIYKANTLPAPDGLQRLDDRFLKDEFFSFLPSFHVAGIGWGLVLPMFSDSVPVLPLPGRPPSTDAFIEALKYGDFKWAFLLPVIIDQLSQDSDALDLVAKKLQYLFYTGGALPEEAGQVVSSKIPVFSGLGSSEASALPQVLSCDLPDSETWRESWQYIHIHPSAGPEFRKCMDNLYELVIIKSKEHAEAQPVFAMFPELSEYSTRDLFTPHPNTRNLWRHCGRRDDIVVFLNGEKTNPISFEDHVSRHPAVRAALVAGNQRFEACLLVEPAAENLSDTAKANLIEAIWPTVEEANRQCPAHARVFKTKILVLDSDKPMLRAGKGTVQRAGTVQLYAKQIDALYSDSESATHESKPNVSISSLEDALNALRPLVLEITGWSVPDDVDFSALGMDSLHVLRLSAAIASEFGIPMSPAVIYKNPTIEFLARQVYPHGTASNEYDRIETMTQLLQRYEKQIDQLATQSAKVSNNVEASHVVILTGSTGTVGSFLLDRLVSSADISHIYCLNRAPDSRCLQVARNQRRAIPCDFPAEKVTFLTVDLAKDRFSLDEATYDTLLNHTTQIIHNAWPVDFNQPLQFFEASLDGLLSLVAFTTKAKLNPTLLFLSSVSSVSSYETIPNHSAPVPETTIMDPSCTAPIGYGESKYVGERIMHYASTKIPRSFGVCRVDQVAGTAQNPRGWNKHEWLPSLIISSRYLQALPRSLSANNEDIITWIPVDELVSILIELSSSLATSIDPELTGPTGQLQVFHCANRNFADWQRHLVPVVQEELKMDLSSDEEKCLKRPELIDFDAWLSVLRDTIVREGANLDIEKVPAAKLVDFYGQLLASPPPADRMTLSVDKTLESSKTLRELQQIQPEWVRGWIREWLR